MKRRKERKGGPISICWRYFFMIFAVGLDIQNAHRARSVQGNFWTSTISLKGLLCTSSNSFCLQHNADLRFNANNMAPPQIWMPKSWGIADGEHGRKLSSRYRQNHVISSPNCCRYVLRDVTLIIVCSTWQHLCAQSCLAFLMLCANGTDTCVPREASEKA